MAERKLMFTTITFITEQGPDTDQLLDEIDATGLVNDWPVYSQTTDHATETMIDWYVDDYLSVKDD